MPTYIRSDQAQILVEVSGVTLDKESWSIMEGGDQTAESAQAFPGGQKPLIALGGFPKRSTITVQRPWTDVLYGAYKTLDGKVGQATVTVAYQNQNSNREPIGTPITYTGVLQSVSRPNYKAGTSEEAKLMITVDPNGEIG